MNASKENWPLGLPENFINCPICSKTLMTPKCLPCLHSFCVNCLKVHIMASERTESSFKCPVCSETIPAPQDGVRPEDWADHFKTNQLINSVREAFELKKGDRKCDPCKNIHKRSPALTWCTICREALCITCTNSHRGMRLTRAHAVIELSKIKSQPVAAIIKDEKCPEHEDQTLQFFCRDHKQQCCPTCAIAIHRKCDNVLEMDKLGKEIRTQQKGEKLLKRLNASLDTQRTLLTSRGNSKEAMNIRKQEILAEIRDLKVKMVDLLNEMESAFIKEFDSLHATQENELQTGIEEAQRIAKAMKNTITILETALAYGSDSQIFITYEKIQEECRRYEKLMIASNKTLNEIIYSFKMDERLKAVANTVRKFGHLSIESDDSQAKSFQKSTVRETAIFGARTPFDDLRGVDIFPNGDIITSDRISKSVSLFHSNGEFASHLNFSSRPWGVAVLGVRTACVSLPENNEIHIIKSSYRKLENYKTITTPLSCFAITNFSGEYLTIQHKEEKDGESRKEPQGRVTIAQSDKQLTHKSVVDITANHEHVQGIAYDEATSKIFIATDFDAIECYNSRGRILFRNSYKGYGDFRGICVDRESNVYVASHAGKGIVQLTHEGERIRMIPTSPLAPLDVALTPRGHKMVVVGRSDVIHVYTFH